MKSHEFVFRDDIPSAEWFGELFRSGFERKPMPGS